jgi:hypothetical protein
VLFSRLTYAYQANLLKKKFLELTTKKELKQTVQSLTHIASPIATYI